MRVVLRMGMLSNHTEFVNSICTLLKEKQMSTLERCQLRRTEEQFFKKFVNKTSKNVIEDSLEKIYDLINNCPGYTLSFFQMKAVDEVLKCFLPNIIKSATSNQLAMIMKKHNMTPCETMLTFLACPRRGGKSDILTMLAGAMFVSVKNCEVLFFSLREGICIIACNLTMKWIVDWGRATGIRKSKLKLYFKNQDSSDQRIIEFVSLQGKNVTYFFYIFIFKAAAFYLSLSKGNTIYFFLS